MGVAAASFKSFRESELIEWVPEAIPGGLGPRAYLRPDLRRFVANLGGEADRSTAAAACHRDYFLSEARRLGFSVSEPGSTASGPTLRLDDGAAMAWLIAERQNLLAVRERFVSTQPEAAAEAVLCLAEGMARRGPYLASLTRLHAALCNLPEDVPAELRSRLLLARGMAAGVCPAGEVGSRDLDATRDLEEARALAARSGLPGLECEAMEQQGLSALRGGLLKEARGFLEPAGRNAAECGQAEVAARLQCSLGLTCEAEGDFEGAEAAFLAALAQATEASAVREQIRSRSRLGAHYYFVNRWEEARDHLRWSAEQAVALRRGVPA